MWTSLNRRRVAFALVGSAAVAVVVALIVAHSRPGRTYYFMPGRLGRVRVPLGAARHAETLTADKLTSIQAAGAAAPSSSDVSVSAFQRVSVSSHHFLTRVISGLRAGPEAQWAKGNGFTHSLRFIENLLNVFPRTLYAKHPKFFPLADGRRLDPPPGYTYWNPDLGRKDVAAYAAGVAKRYFDQHPDAVSFSLGVDDGLVFGESTATLALIGVGPLPLRSNNRSNNKPGSTGGNGDNRAQSSGHSSVASVTSCSKSFPPTPVRWFRHRPDYSRLVFTFMNRAAADLAKRYPDKYLGCLAYYWCENTPGFRVDPHVIPFLTADRSQSYDPAFVKQEFDLQARWAAALGASAPSARHADKLTADTLKSDSAAGAGGKQNADKLTTETLKSISACQRVSVSAFSSAASQRSSVSAEPRPKPRLGLYDYLDDWGFLVPRVPIHAFAMHIRHAHEVGFTDYYGESQRNWGLDGPMPWVIAQLLQNPEQNVDRLLDIYYRNYFGPAAGPMRAFFDRCEYQWMHQPGPSYWLKHYRNESQAMLFPPVVCAELRKLLDKANADTLTTDTLKSGSVPNLAQKETKETKTELDQGPETRDEGSGTLQTSKGSAQEETEITENPKQQGPETKDERPGTSPQSAESVSAFQRSSVSAFGRPPFPPLSPVKPDWSVYRKRVAFVSDSFGVTERFVAFEYARDALSRLVLSSDPEKVGRTVPGEPGSKVGRTVPAHSTSLVPSLSRGSVPTLSRGLVPSLSRGSASRAGRGSEPGSAAAARRDASPYLALEAALKTYLAARREFIRYSFAVTHRWPLAFYPINYTDWLENDPAFAASYELAARNAEKLTTDTLTSIPAAGAAPAGSSMSACQRVSVSASSPESACQLSACQRFSVSPVADGFAAGAAITHGRGLGLLPNGSLEGPLVPGRKIAGLPFGIDLPAPWLSKVEPTQHHLGVVWRPAARTGTQGLRISGAENDNVYQWVAAKPGELYAASVAVRGHVSLSCEVTLVFNFMDAGGHLGTVRVMRLPDGGWPKWVTLRQGARAPANAAWVGVGLRVQHQAPGDWVEADDFSLRAAR